MEYIFIFKTNNIFLFKKGNVYGGVIGKDIVRYDIYGKDVAIANKMESEGQVDNVAVSEEARFLLEQEPKHKWTFKFLKNFTCKASDK